MALEKEEYVVLVDRKHYRLIHRLPDQRQQQYLSHINFQPEKSQIFDCQCCENNSNYIIDNYVSSPCSPISPSCDNIKLSSCVFVLNTALPIIQSLLCEPFFVLRYRIETQLFVSPVPVLSLRQADIVIYLFTLMYNFLVENTFLPTKINSRGRYPVLAPIHQILFTETRCLKTAIAVMKSCACSSIKKNPSFASQYCPVGGVWWCIGSTGDSWCIYCRFAGFKQQFHEKYVLLIENLGWCSPCDYKYVTNYSGSPWWSFIRTHSNIHQPVLVN